MKAFCLAIFAASVMGQHEKLPWPLPQGAILKWSDPATANPRRLCYVVPGSPASSIAFYKRAGYADTLARKTKERAVFRPSSKLVITVTTFSHDFGSQNRISGAMPPKGKHFIEVLTSR